MHFPDIQRSSVRFVLRYPPRDAVSWMDQAQQWDGLEIIELPNCSRVAFQGRRPNTVGGLC